MQSCHIDGSCHARALALAAVLTASCGSSVGPKAQAARSPRHPSTRIVTNTPGVPIDLTAQRMTTALRDGSAAPMWGFCESSSCTSSWAPGPTIVANAGEALEIRLTNNLNVPTSLVVLGQLGGGLGTPQTMPSPAHTGQKFTTFVGNSPADPPFVPPAQGPRVRSFGAEAAAASTVTSGGVATFTPGSVDLTWASLRPGTYLYETGTMPSLQVPMGLYGVLVVNAAPGSAYPDVQYDDQVTLLFSEMDPVQNAAVDAAATAGTDVSLRFNDPACMPDCYPAAVNYTPTYFFINGRFFDKTAPQASAFLAGDTASYASGNILVRMLNAGSRTHVPALVGLPMSLVAEDGSRAPGIPKVQNEVLLTAGKTWDAVVRPEGSGSSYKPATYAVFDRALSLTTAAHSDGGMQGFLLLNHAAAAAATYCAGTSNPCTGDAACGGAVGSCIAAQPGNPGMLPATVAPAAVDDVFAVPCNATFSGNVTANDVSVVSAAVVDQSQVTNGALAFNPDGSFTYLPASCSGASDTFTYSGNGGTTNTATVTLHIASAGGPPVAADDSYTSNISGRLSVPRPGVLANDTDPSGYPLTAGSAAPAAANGCTSVSMNPDGSFSVTGAGPSCQFTYLATNSQGTASNPATVTVSFGAASHLVVSVADAMTGTAISDYRWTLQEDLTFKHDVSGTPAVSTRTIGTSFHRSHMTVVATGCVGPVSCGSGQQVRGAAVSPAPETSPGDVALDPTKNYYLSILPGDAGDPVVSGGTAGGHMMGGAEVKQVNGAWAPVAIRLETTPITTAQMSIYIYEDNSPTNGQNEPGESGLGGFNIILMDPAGRTGDVAGQQTYDAFNMPLSNYLLGTPGCPDELNANTNGTGTSSGGNLVGVVYTCPSPPPGYTGDPAVYALAGHALIKNLTPARYDVIAHPGAAREGSGEVWWQTETLEGTPAQDAFVGINEPVYFQEFGPPGFHTTIGFVNPNHLASNLLTGSTVITGHITNQHMSRPSDVTLWNSASYDMLFSTTCEVVLNSQAGDGPAIAAAQCNPDGTFTIQGVPPGDYDLAVFDQWLDQIIQNVTLTVPPATATVALGDIPVLSWFTQQDLNIFQDLNGNGVYDPGEPGISNVPLTVRYRNGAPSNTTLSDSSGNGILVELFPLFNWYVTEADTTRFKQTGVHIWVDGGGKPDTSGEGAGLWTSTYAYAPDGTTDRTEIPGQLSYGIQGFISQRNRVDWGRAPYVKGENGGITGYVVYSSTRPFDDMRLNVQTLWEPLVPRVVVNLYRQDTLQDGTRTLTLVDTTTTSSWDDFVNRVYGADNNQYLLGSDNLLRVPETGALAPTSAYPPGVQVNMQCPGQDPADPFVNYTLGAGDRKRCYDGWHDWNQVQAAPYDGRYVFPSPAWSAAHPLTDAQKAAGQTLVSFPPGTYVVEAVTPPGYEIVKEEDKNILIGDAFVGPAPQQFGPLASIFILPDQATLNNANPYNPGTGDPGFQSDPTTNLGVYGISTGTVFPECVGNLHRVPDYLSLFPQAQQVAPFAGMDRPLCDRKRVVLNDQMQTSATFFVFTQVPAAANNTGIILDDATSEFNAVSPDFGEKASVPFVPVSIKDFNGVEIGRTYSDQWGAYNMMTPSSWLVNPPTPSGYGPNMLITCMNDPGPILDPASGQLVTDPHYNPAYSNFCYTNPFMPSQTTYLDTPVLPIAAFASGYNPPDCAQPDATPAISRVDGGGSTGPWLPSSGGTLTITALGDVQVPNPAYSGPFAANTPQNGTSFQQTITRHYGFGNSPGRLRVGAVDLTANVTSWADGSISVNVPAGTPTGELAIATAAGRESVDTVTVTIEGTTPPRHVPGDFPTIQAAIDNSDPGALIIVDAGTYNELVIMYKPVRLQGVGAASVIINAAKYPNAKLDGWRTRINQLFNIDPTTGNQLGPAQVDPLPTQEITGGIVLLEPTVLGMEEGAGITVLARNLPITDCFSPGVTGSDSNFLCAQSRIDGLSVTGGDAGGGIYVNGWAHGLEISNNRVYGNAGAYNGGVRVGVPYLELESLPGAAGPGTRTPGFGYDDFVRIHHNSITRNGTVEAPQGNGGAGGGVSICTGTDGYSVDHNFICGNYSSSDGGGIGHLGFSQGGSITNNQILFNQSFQQTNQTNGGGIVVAGEPPIAGAVSLGTGDLTIDSNLIRGNLAEGGHGGGIRLQQVNGAEVTANPGIPGRWHTAVITNNMIVNNVAGYAGGGISLADTLHASILNNTISSNDSVGIAGVVLAGGVALPAETPGVAGMGVPSPAGIVSEPTSAALVSQVSGAGLRNASSISHPDLVNNIVWKNRSFYYSGSGSLCAGNDAGAVGGGCATLPDQSASGQCVSGAAYWEIGVLGDSNPTPGAKHLDPTYSIMTSTSGYTGAGNGTSDPQLANLYCNGSRVVPEWPGVIDPPSVKNLQVAATLDEGNNYVNLRFGPLYTVNPATGAPFGDYHLGSASPAIDVGAALTQVPLDFDRNPRPQGLTWDIGADEVLQPGGSDLAITNTDGRTSVIPGTAGVTYTLVVTNNGPVAAGNATVSDTPPPASSFSVTSWTCAASSGSSCSAAAGGSLARTGTVSLLPGGTATFSLRGNVSSAATAGGTLTNSARVIPGAGTTDPNPANNAANDTDTVVRGTVAFTSSTLGTLSGTALAFGNLSGPQSATVRLTVGGTAPVTFSAAAVTNTTGTAFSKGADSCTGTTVPVGGTCTIQVLFNAPAGTSSRAARLSVTDNGTGSPQVLNLTGS